LATAADPAETLKFRQEPNMSYSRIALLGLCAVLVAMPAMVPAQVQPPPANWLPQLTPVQIQTHRARANYLGPDFWTDLAPATYSIRMPGTDLCLTRTLGAIRAEMPHFRLRACRISTALDGLSNSDQLIEAAPGAVDVPPAPGFSNVRWRFTSRNECAGSARNVWIGPPRVDFNPCDLMPYAGGDVAHRGAQDQLFFIRRMSGSGDVPRFQIRSPERKCWTVQGGDLRDGTQLVVEDCDGRAGQTFEFRYFMSLVTQSERDAAEKFGWMDAAAINRPVTTADRFRDLPALAITNPGYSTAPTANDRGSECAARCRTDDNCRAFSWTPPNANSGAMCKLTQAYWPHELVSAPGTNSGIMRP
jgi:hypothetical protein